MTLSFTHSPAYLILIVLLAGGLTFLMYRQSSDLLPRAIRYLLSAFRFVILSLIGLLLLEPLINSLSKLSFPPIVAVVQDNSESLVVQQDSAFVRNEYPQLLKSFQASFEGEEYVLDGFAFDRELKRDLQADSLRFDQTGTNISSALKGVRDLYQNQNLGAIVLLTDGIATAGINPLYTVENLKTPVFTVLVGDTTTQKDIQIKEVLFNEIAYLENDMPIRVKLASTGFEQANIKVSILQGKKVLDAKSLRLGKDKNNGEVNFLIRPEEVGVQRYVISVSRLDGEITYRNNVRSIFVNVLETRVKIALFAGSPHPDLGALEQAFARDKSYEVNKFVLKQPGTFYRNPENENLEDFDLFILHNFPQSSRDQVMVEKITEVVKKEKKPVIFFVGTFTDLPTMAPLYDYMAITPKGISPKTQEVIANFSPEYERHSTFTFDEGWLQWANNAPPIYRNQSNWEAKSSAEVYATAKIKNIALDYPVLALQNQLGRKNMTFLGENFWRMRAHSFVEGNDFERFDAWLFNNIKWLIVSDDKRKFRVDPAKRIFSGGEPVSFKGQVYDDSYNPIQGVDIKLTLTSPDGKDNDYYLNETGQAQYFLELFNLEEGTYSYRAEGKKNEIKVGTDRGQFSIGRSNIEHFQLQANRDLMEQIALRTGGSFTYARDLPELADAIKALPGLKPVIDYK
ncbi:MAG: hypothetical protein AAF206_27380, partial [Bacteroidota bacterium]